MLVIELYAGLHGWAEGFLAEGFQVVAFDIEDMCAKFGQPRPPGVHLVLQDVLTLHGSQFRNAACIVASPPCQAYSYRAMPWKRAKALPPPDNSLFDACFRIQREACEAAGHYIPMVVENVVGAQRWVGSAKYHYGSFYLWGDVPALMPYASSNKNGHANTWFGIQSNGDRYPGQPGNPVRHAMKNTGGSWFGQRDGKPLERNDPRDMRRGENGEWTNAEARGGWNHPGKALDGTKGFAKRFEDTPMAWHSSRSSSARKAASAQIAKIPFALASHIARCFKPE